MSDEPTKKVRGKGVRPAMVHVNLRLPLWVVEHYKRSTNYTAAMRDALTLDVLNKQMSESNNIST